MGHERPTRHTGAAQPRIEAPDRGAKVGIVSIMRRRLQSLGEPMKATVSPKTL